MTGDFVESGCFLQNTRYEMHFKEGSEFFPAFSILDPPSSRIFVSFVRHFGKLSPV